MENKKTPNRDEQQQKRCSTATPSLQIDNLWMTNIYRHICCLCQVHLNCMHNKRNNNNTRKKDNNNKIGSKYLHYCPIKLKLFIRCVHFSIFVELKYLFVANIILITEYFITFKYVVYDDFFCILSGFLYPKRRNMQ